MGYAIRTDRYRYVEWRDWTSKRIMARELYDHAFDPHEMRNLVETTSVAETVEELAGMLARGWTSALPHTTDD